MLGCAEGAFDLIMPYILQRKQFGKPIAEFQGVQFQYATMALGSGRSSSSFRSLSPDIYTARVLVYNAARQQEAGLPFATEAAMAKLYASQCAERVASKAIELAGGMGFVKDLGIEKFYRDCKVGQIYEGTSNIQLQTIAKEVARTYAGKS